MIEIKEPGLWTTVQDMGRFGKYHLGVPPSGAADKYSFMIGNLLVGNPVEFAALEMTLIGGTFEFHRNLIIVLTGAPMEAYLNNKPLPFWVSRQVKEGDILTIKACQKGVKSYLCISGGVKVQDVLGSKSTYELSQIGGFHGRKLAAGDKLQINEPLPGASKQIGKSIPLEFVPSFNHFQEIRVTMGLSGYLMSDHGLKTFLNSEWTVSHESNRVAYRYTGARVSLTGQHPPFGAGNSFSNVVDFAYPIGSIMFPNEEELIVLQNDATTGGGFVTIGTVISQDLDRIAQSRPSSKCHFIAVTIDQAIQARAERRNRLETLVKMIKR
ncbi:biotin-dependent carboxyltransferase family protein [Bacillus sp. FJAT-29790]|uniref:5-oxoprolinase subunit C family protein n=1 Tax=Bacillus sp. FJAT-29790 TaxID=1895002 RepID=UPI001C2405B2|nr:biotin-dependent carboxyltransferase family protein [Bacillus sp. FJAT-29790]MBU8880728.1 biotin-dependent carboxyltransferase family protein [Bacillus sp. FJAT-29790]